MDVVVMWEHAYFKRICFIASTLSSQIYLIFFNRCNASSSSSCNDRPVSNTQSSRSLFLIVLSDDFFLFFGRHLQTKTSYSNSNCMHNSTDHKPQIQLGLTTVKLCLMSAVFHKAYNDQQHQFGPEVFCSEIMWLVTLSRCNVTCCESISTLEAFDWHCSVIGRFHHFHRPRRPLGWTEV